MLMRCDKTTSAVRLRQVVVRTAGYACIISTFLKLFARGQLRCCQGFDHAACGGCNAMHPEASRNWCRPMLIRSAVRCSKRLSCPLLSSSAHVLRSPAMWVTSSSMWCRAAHAAAGALRCSTVFLSMLQRQCCRTLPASKRSIAVPPSHGALSLRGPTGLNELRPNCSDFRCVPLLCKPRASALLAVTIQLPMPTMSPSALAPAAAKQCKRGFCRSVRLRSCAKHVQSHCSASLRICYADQHSFLR